MAITATSTLTGLTDTSPSGSPVYTVTKRCVSTKTINLLDNADMLELKTAAFGDALDYLMTPVDTHEHGRSRLRSTTITPVPGSGGKICDVVGRYDSMYTFCDVGVAGRLLLLPVTVELDSTPRPVIMHRTNDGTTWGTPPSANLNTTTDIGGTKVDYASKPLPGLVDQQTLRVSLIVDTSIVTLTALFDRMNTVSGKWNTTAFLHWGGANQVYCETAQISHVRDEYYRMTYLLKWDRWYGCEQIPRTDVNGRAAIDDQGQAQTVTWKSVLRGTTNLNAIFDDHAFPTIAKQIAKEGSFLTYP